MFTITVLVPGLTVTKAASSSVTVRRHDGRGRRQCRASLSASGPPIVCAAHSDQLPAGASAEAAAAPSSGLLQWYAAGGIAVVLIAVSVVVVVRRRTAPAR